MLSFLIFSLIFCMWLKYYYPNTENKFSKDKKLLWIISSLISFLLIVIYFVFRYGIAIDNVVNYDLFNLSPSDFRSNNISGVLMLDICSFLSIAFLFLVIFDWKHKYILKPISVLCILGGVMNLVFSAIPLYNSYQWDAYTFFLGAKTFGVQKDAPLTFIMHYWMIIGGSLVLMYSKMFKIRDYLVLLAIAIIYISYVIACSYSLKIYSHVTAVVAGDYVSIIDWYPGYYNPVDLKGNPLIDRYGDIITSPIRPPYHIFMSIFPIKQWQWGAVFAYACLIMFVVIILLIKWLFDKYEYMFLNKFLFKTKYFL